MKTVSVESIRQPQSWWIRFCRQQVGQRLALIEDACLVVVEQGQTLVFGSPTASLKARVIVHDPDMWQQLTLRGALGAGESYMTGDWSADHLPTVIRILARNRQVLQQLDSRWARIGRLPLQWLAWQQRNNEKGSRRNIAAHYDLGNELFETFLDPTMMYSSAIFPSPDASLEQASIHKLDRICQKLQLSQRDHLLEIGTGWGSMAIHAARHYGCRVTTTTISEQQYQFARQRIIDAGLQDRITLLKQDYRQLQGRFDKLVSIEMIEAVGHDYLPTYLRCLQQRLKPDGLALIQAITIRDQHYNAARHNVDFIKRYIFPGGFLPSVTHLQQVITAATELRSLDLEDIGCHYAETLRHWRQRFLGHRETIQQHGYDDTFMRMWDYYFAYCEGGFDEGVISTVQLLLCGQRWQPQPVRNWQTGARLNS